MYCAAISTNPVKSICYAAYEFFHRLHVYLHRPPNSTPRRRTSLWRPDTASDIFLPYDKKNTLSNINLVLKPGCTYLVLGPPASGKTTLLKAIAGRLPSSTGLDGKPVKDKPHAEGSIQYNGVHGADLILPNVVSL
jgi:ABC-type protease/lipase transport system fused ATPase/permease subunit